MRRLRRAWSADPTIRDFIGLSENSWDFNAPGAIGGFGPLEMTDDLRRMVAQLFTPAPSEQAAAGSTPKRIPAEHQSAFCGRPGRRAAPCNRER